LEPNPTPDQAQNNAPAPGDEGGHGGAVHQSEMPFAIVQGQPITQLPEDLYIPPEALEVILEAFEGPLDLLLYLIRRQNLDILDIPIAEISRQYIEYVEMLQDLKFDLAAEYLVMAAILCEIKSRMLLPRPASEEGEEQDPRAELVRRLQEYERFKKAAEDLDELPRIDRDFSLAAAYVEDRSIVRLPPEVDLLEILRALRDVMSRAEMFSSHHVQAEPLSVRERMSIILDILSRDSYVEFHRLFTPQEGRAGVVVSFLALLEMSREALIEIVQNEPPGQIYVKSSAYRD